MLYRDPLISTFTPAFVLVPTIMILKYLLIRNFYCFDVRLTIFDIHAFSGSYELIVLRHFITLLMIPTVWMQ